MIEMYQMYQRELGALGEHAEIAYTGDGWSARVSIQQPKRKRLVRISEHGDSPLAAKQAAARAINTYRRSWGLDDLHAASLAALS